MTRPTLLSIFCLVTGLVPWASTAALKHTETCIKLKAKFGDKVSLPNTDQYNLIAPENWSIAAQRSPYCVFEPSGPQDVAGALAILTKDETKFAVRGGGHMPVPGASGIQNGVLISMNNIRTMQMTKDNSIAQIGPGLRWGEVANWISPYGLMVAGGRFGPVGVPGLLLGGGISYFGSKYGWSANRVANFEVVLANSTVVNANAKENSDLFWALKGGSSNYGIVTRFDLKTFPLGEVYGGESTFSGEYLDDLVNAAASYSVAGGGVDDTDGAYNVAFEVLPGSGTVRGFAIYFHFGGASLNMKPNSFTNFTRVPTMTSNERTWANLGEALNETGAFGVRNQRQLFMATALEATPESIFLANTTFFEVIDEMPELKKVANLSLAMSPQPLSRSFLEAARASGGDPMDVEPGNGKIMNLMGSGWDKEEDDEVVYEFNRRWISRLEQEGKKLGVDYPFVYLNDAATSQNPFALYGQGKSLKKMRAIRDRYDPQHVFQKLVPGGFKLG